MPAIASPYLSSALGLLKRSLEIIVGLLVLGVVFCVVANVFGRFVLNYSYVWAEELSRLLFIWLVLLGAGLGSLNNEHVAVTFFRDKAPTPLRRVFGVLSVLVVYVVCVCILLGFQDLMAGYISVTPLLKIPKSVLYSAMPVMAVLALIANTLVLVQLLKRSPT